MKIVQLPQALVDLVETAEYIAQDDVKVADRFFDAFEKTLRDIRETPKIGTVRKFRNKVDVRMWYVPGFEKSLIFYTENADEIVILRVIHAARDYTRFF
jgi:plasmid stabilization system protein ParE